MPNHREVYLDYMARCQQAFRPFAPIDLPDFFKGRQTDVELLVSELGTPGRQVAIYGERGVGKTSLAQLAYFFARFSDEHTYFVRCETGSTYDTVFGQVLVQADMAYVPNGIDAEAGRRLAIGGRLGAASHTKTTRSRQQAIESARSIGPAMLLKEFGSRKGLIILDEYDRVHDTQTNTRLAETLKHFSDAASETKIIVVGVAETLGGLIGEHASLTRCLAQIKLDRMSIDELGEIVDAGQERIGLAFKESVRNKIVALSDGFPFYTHLLCLYCAEDAGRVLTDNPHAHVVVAEAEYKKAVRRAIETAASTLGDDYQAAVITVKRKTEMFKHVLWGVAYAEPPEVQVQEIAENIGVLTARKPRIESLSSYLGALTKPEKKQVLVRVRQGYYKFANPLMRAYVRLILEEHNMVEADGQMQFPWMRDAKTARPSR